MWAGDGDRTLKVIDITTFKITDIVTVTDPTNKNVKMRVDEMAWDVSDHILAAANNANTPPFITLINTDTHEILGQIVFDGKGSTPDATKTGIEQPQWSPQTGLFYVSVPQIDPNDATLGGVSVIDPHSMTVIATYPVTNCSPAGLALGPNYQAIIGCGGSIPERPPLLRRSSSILTMETSWQTSPRRAGMTKSGSTPLRSTTIFPHAALWTPAAR